MVGKGFNVGGFRSLGQYRLRNVLFWTRTEELVEHQDGRLEWRGSPFPVSFFGAPSLMAPGGGQSLVAVAVAALRSRGHAVTPDEGIPGLYLVDGRELTTNQVVDLARQVISVRA